MSLFFEIGLLVVGLSVIALIFRLLRQPLLPVYLLAGFLLGPVLHLVPASQIPTLESFSLIGIAFLLFVAGLELDLVAVFKNFKIALFGFLFAALNSLIFILLFSRFSVFQFLGSDIVILGVVFSFSSTLLVVKFLSEQNRLNTTLGFLALAILLAQDLLAIFCLALVEDRGVGFSTRLMGIGVLTLSAFIGGFLLFPRLFRFAAFSEELLFLVSLGVLFLFSMISQYFGLSLAAGAFIGGLSLSSLMYRYEIASKMRPLRDFFVILLFLSLGLQISLDSFKVLLWPFVVLLCLTFVLKPVIYILMGFGFRLSRYLSAETGLIMAQSSEFSLPVAYALSPQAFSLAGFNFLASSFLSSYLFEYLEKLSLLAKDFLNKILPNHLFKREIEDKELRSLRDHVIIFGGHRMGSRIIKTLSRLKKKIVLIDHNPDIIARFKNRILSIYGDALESEIRKKAGIAKASMIISTIPEPKINFMLIREVNQLNPQAFVYVVANDYSEALKLYEQGADFVILPYFLGAEQANVLLENFDQAMERLAKTKENHFKKIAEEARKR